MESSKESQDSGIETSMEASFHASRRLFESTPKIETQSTPNGILNPRKRKFSCLDGQRRLNNVEESCPSTPQFSSTLNDSSITRKFNEISIQESYYFTDSDEHVSKYLKDNRYAAVSSTPEHQVLHVNATPKKVSNLAKCAANFVAASPLKEKHEILYPTIVLKTPIKKPLTPQRFKEKLDRSVCLKKIRPKGQTAFNEFLSNGVIMEEVFHYLSSGDIFRFSMVDTKCRMAVFTSLKARQRHAEFLDKHKINKENYTITPPSSPEQCALEPGSPNSRYFRSFTDLSRELNQLQTLIKCPICSNPSIVQNSIAQCQKSSCGYIYCKNCSSFAYSPGEFVDKCKSSNLIVTPSSNRQPRKGLLDFSNNSLLDSLTLSPILHSTIYQSSGYASNETSVSQVRVKKNLSKSFATNEEQPIKALFETNRSMLKITHLKGGNKPKVSLVPVVGKANVKQIEQVPEPSSPPRVKPYSACSKKSKQNLKRLTR